MIKRLLIVIGIGTLIIPVPLVLGPFMIHLLDWAFDFPHMPTPKILVWIEGIGAELIVFIVFIVYHLIMRLGNYITNGE